MQSDGTGDVANIVKGVDYAVKNGATVLNLSLGTYANSSALRQALEKAYQSAVIVAAAGNDGACIYASHFKKHHATPAFPAAYSFVLGVQATTAGGGMASFSNYDDDGPLTSCEATSQDPDGFNYELKAPGTNILSTIPGGGYQTLQGTSMASPLVAGAISALQMVKQYDTQEILWGDLLHSNDIAKAYNVSVRPAVLDVMRISLRDRNEMTEYDEANNTWLPYYVVNVGETLKIYPVIRSSFGKATNIKLKILVPSGIEIVKEEADFGNSLDAFGKAVSKNPLVIKVPDEMPNASSIPVTVQVTCDESNEIFSNSSIDLRVSNMYTLKGLITEDMTLSSDHAYYVISNVLVDERAILTIEPGTRIEFASGKSIDRGYGKIIAKGTPEKPIIFTPQDKEKRWGGSITADTLSYCRVTDGNGNGIVCHDCIFEGVYFPYGERNVITDARINIDPTFFYSNRLIRHTNIVNGSMSFPLSIYSSTKYFTPNLINTFATDNSNKKFILTASGNTVTTIKLDSLPYFGTAREDFVRPLINEYGNSADGWWGETYATLDLSNMPKQPYKEAHGIVWKVMVNGKDAQDEQEDLLPLGVGKHKFEVYFNRPMNKAVIPQISFGVISPYNQHPVSEDGSWNEEGTVYTAYATIDGKTRSDGMNRIYVRDAEDNEFFPCPYESTRFNIMLQAAGSMASGFQADAGLGCVSLTWNNENNDFEDAMGFNVYRYTQGENGVNDTIRINEETLDISATSYIDDNVTPGQTYYYYYKVLSTALQEYDVSNVVAATPLTATRGDANGSGSVDVADVVTTVNYVTGLQPKPFVFDAADMNSDKLIDIFDVVGIIRGILNPSLLATASLNEETAIYTIEDGTLYLESPVTLGGVQVQLTLDGRGKMEDVSIASDLDGFETASAWLSDNDYLFLAYSMNGKTLAPGKHALLHIGDADITSLRLSDTSGKNVNVNQGGTTGIDRMGKHVMNVEGVYDLQGRKLSTQNFELSTLKKGIYIINGKKVVK